MWCTFARTYPCDVCFAGPARRRPWLPLHLPSQRRGVFHGTTWPISLPGQWPTRPNETVLCGQMEQLEALLPEQVLSALHVRDLVVVSSNDSENCRVGQGRRTVWNSSTVYPTGVKYWRDAANCQAAVDFDCPCGNWCLSKTKNGLTDIYEHRRQFRSAALRYGVGQLRDRLRDELAYHYNLETGAFERTFKVGGSTQVLTRTHAHTPMPIRPCPRPLISGMPCSVCCGNISF